MEAWVLANSVAHDDEMAASWPLYRLASVNGEVLDARPPDAFLWNPVALRWYLVRNPRDSFYLPTSSPQRRLSDVHEYLVVPAPTKLSKTSKL